MANVKITALTNLASADVADGDVFVIDDISQTESKKVTIANLKSVVFSSFANARYVTTTANSYNIGVTVATINEVDVYVGGAYQSKKEYVLANSSHNVQFTDATFVAGEDIEIISRS